MRISDWSSDVCSSDLLEPRRSDAVARDLDPGGAAVVRQVERPGVMAVARQCNQIRVGALRRREQARARRGVRSEEHTSELQSLMRISYAVFCLKKKKKQEINMMSILRSQSTSTQYIIRHRKT